MFSVGVNGQTQFSNSQQFGSGQQFYSKAIPRQVGDGQERATLWMDIWNTKHIQKTMFISCDDFYRLTVKSEKIVFSKSLIHLGKGYFPKLKT